MDKINKPKSKYIINQLAKLPIYYNFKINYINNKIGALKKEYPDYGNFLENYFIKNKLKFFISGELNFALLPPDCSSISYLEKYNKIFKESLGKNKYIHWLNYIHFIKSESTRIKDKIYKNCNQNILLKSKFTKFG